MSDSGAVVEVPEARHVIQRATRRQPQRPGHAGARHLGDLVRLGRVQGADVEQRVGAGSGAVMVGIVGRGAGGQQGQPVAHRMARQLVGQAKSGVGRRGRSSRRPPPPTRRARRPASPDRGRAW